MNEITEHMVEATKKAVISINDFSKRIASVVPVHLHVNARTYDPTRTTTLRNTFANDLKRRFVELARVITMAIVQEDCFGLQPEVFQLTTPGRKAFAFSRSSDKVGGFMRWLDEQTRKGILEVGVLQQVGGPIEMVWTNKYITDSYKRGVIRARYEMKKYGFSVPSIEETGGVQASISTPFHVDRLGVLYTRVFNDLKGITTSMDTLISRTLTEGLANGDNPRLIARKLVAVVDGRGKGTLGLTDSLGRFIPAKRRAEILARTEIIRAHHKATIQEYRNWGVEGVAVQAEWVTAGDNRVCPDCQARVGNGSLENGYYTLDEIEAMIPLHPQCRCIALPAKDVSGKSVRSTEQEMTRELTEQEKVAIGNYSLTDYSGINTILRQGGNIRNSGFESQINKISSGISAGEKYKGIVYRGMRFDRLDDYNTFMSNIESGNYLIDKGFMSTSKSEQIAQRFYSEDPLNLAKKRVKFKVQATSKGGFDLESIGIEKEKEIVFQKSSKFKVKSRTTIIERNKYGEDIDVELIELIEL